jgi:two-component system phosphate regulon sensor histidine kinase PhoR
MHPFAAVPIIASLGVGAVICGREGPRAVASAQVEPPPAETANQPHELLELLPDPVILLNGSREIVGVNRHARDVLGVGMLGRDLALSLRHPDVLAAVETLFAGIPSITEEILLPVPVSRTYTLHGGLLAPSDDPQAPRVVLVLHDETRAKRAEELRADFVANASHELRSPLSSVIGFIETLRGPAQGDTVAQDRFLALMQSEAHRMARLVDDLMSLSRVEINEHVPPKGNVDLAEIVPAIADTLSVRAAEKKMWIETELPDELPHVIGDSDQLTQIVINLLDNAIKYGREGSPVRVVGTPISRLPGQQYPGVSIAVNDQGDGIAPIHLPRLTERFYRIDQGRSRRMGGTGLGLAIVKHMVSRHRGRLTIESQLGVGSTFTVILPAAHSVPISVKSDVTQTRNIQRQRPAS